MPTSTVGLGKTYTSLQAWADAVSFNSGTEDAECYSGADLGGCFLLSWTPSSTTIYVANGHQHNGQDVGTTGVAYAGDIIYTESATNLTIRGLRTHEGVICQPNFVSADCTYLVENILSLPVSDPILARSISIEVLEGPGNCTATLRNNIVMWKSSVNGEAAIGASMIGGLTFNAALTISLFNNTVSQTGGTMLYGLFLYHSGQGSITATTANNISLKSAPDIACFGIDGDATFAVGSGYNLASDGTASSWGATGALDSQTPSDVIVDLFVNPTLKTTSPARNTGLTIGSFSTDAIGVTRPQGIAWDRGALELVAAAFNNLRRRRLFRFWNH